MVTQNTAQMKMNFLQTKTETKSRPARILQTLHQRHSLCSGTETEENNSSTQFLELQKNQLNDLQEHFER